MTDQNFCTPQGYVRPGFESVKEALGLLLETKYKDASGSFAAYYRGELVVNIWTGLADHESSRPWKEDTVSSFFSAGKSLIPTVIAHLVDRGYMRYEDKVVQYWPEFAQNGKGEITVKQLASNRAGLAELEEKYSLRLTRDDPQKMERLLAKQRPLWTPGEAHGYSPTAYGLYMDQIVRKVDPKRRNLSQYFKEEIAEPFGIDFGVGLPKEKQYRLARIRAPPAEEVTSFYDFLLLDFHGERNILNLTRMNPTDWRKPLSMHDPDFLDLVCPSSHGMGTAAGLAKLHGILANGTDQSGRRILSDDKIQLLKTPISWGTDKTYGIEDIYSLGLNLLPVVEGNEVNYLFGHGGLGGQFGAADTKYKVGWAYTTNQLRILSFLTGDNMWSPVVRSLYSCIHRLEGVKTKRRTYRSFSSFTMPNGSKL